MKDEKIILKGVIQTIPPWTNGRIYSEDAFRKSLYDYLQKIKIENRIDRLNKLLDE